LHTLINKFFFF